MATGNRATKERALYAEVAVLLPALRLPAALRIEGFFICLEELMRGSKAVPQEEKPVRGYLLSMEKAAEKIGMSKEWIYKRMQTGTLPFPWFMPCPGKRLIDSADIEDWQRITKIPVGAMPGNI